MQSGEAPLSTAPLRSLVSEHYAAIEQKDAFEFLVDLLHALHAEGTAVKDLLTGIECEEERCTSCSHRSIAGHDQFQVMRLHFPETDNSANAIKFTEMVQHWFPFDRRCSLCGSAKERRTVMRVTPKFLCLAICRYQQEGRLVSCPITGYTANDVRIAGKQYRTVGAICHEGRTTESGHYWALLKTDRDWVCVNDNKIHNVTRFVSHLKNVYLIILQSVSMTEESVEWLNFKKLIKLQHPAKIRCNLSHMILVEFQRLLS
jgi:uncharacterized UBP type Zn finger protein